MNKEDDDDEDRSVGAVRYSCMPSLVALQQMRNRLHLAHLGKKLMKWTAIATGRELRRLAWEIIEVYQSFCEDLRTAFILLARGRYFYPTLNKMVLQNIPHQANVTVLKSPMTISGVKVFQLNVVESGFEPYEHLGIAIGGQAIREAKGAWLNLLKKLILMLQQRTSFMLLEVAHKNATKKRNVLLKIIIPRTVATIKYIIIELDEKDREEMFRLKRFQQLKNKRKKNEQEFHICCCCLAMYESEENVKESVCPICQNAVKTKGKQSEIRLNLVPCKSAESEGRDNKKRLEHLMSHIDDVIDLTKQYKMEGILTPSIEKFIRTCNEVKQKIEDYSNSPPLCDVCKKALENTGSRIALATRTSRTGSSKSLDYPTCTPDRPTEELGSVSTYNLSPETEEKLGYFEKKFKEIVKVTRLQNEDGSISEDKQVITIKTERRNPRRPNEFDDRNDDSEKFMGSCGVAGNDAGNGGGGGGGGTNGGCYGARSGYGEDEGRPNCHNIGPRETKSEHANRSHQMREPKLRSCMSASHPKATMNRDASTNFDASAFISIKPSKVTLPQEPNQHKEPCSGLTKISKGSSIDSQICCPRKTASVSCSDLQSSISSLVSLESCKQPVSKTISAQACCKDVPIKKPMEDKSTCCLPVCESNAKWPDNNDLKHKTASTDALWRDVWTSTADLTTLPNKIPSKKSSPTPSFNRKQALCEKKDSDESVGNKRKLETAGSCCTIKIIAKPPKVCCLEEKEKEEKIKEKVEEEEVVLRGSMLDAIRKIFIPPNRSTESCKFEPKEPEIKNICKSCLSKLNSSLPSLKTTNKSFTESSTCKMCQVKPEEEVEQEINSCTSYGTPSKYSSCDSMSKKSIGVGSVTSVKHTCSKSQSQSAHSRKHTCCLSKKSSDESSDADTCCAMAQTKSSKSVCCSKKKSSSVCCSARGSASSKDSALSKESASSKDSAPSKCSASPTCSATSIKPSASCVQKQDATTCTRRSARFDVRPLRKKHTCKKINLSSCTCYSDSYVLKNRGQNRKTVQRSKSFCEDEYYFFRW